MWWRRKDADAGSSNGGKIQAKWAQTCLQTWFSPEKNQNTPRQYSLQKESVWRTELSQKNDDYRKTPVSRRDDKKPRHSELREGAWQSARRTRWSRRLHQEVIRDTPLGLSVFRTNGTSCHCSAGTPWLCQLVSQPEENSSLTHSPATDSLFLLLLITSCTTVKELVYEETPHLHF